MSIEQLEIPGFTLIGYAVRLKHVDVERINLHWQRFFTEGHVARIPGRLDSRLIALYSDYESDQDGLLQLTLGAAVGAQATAPAGLVRIDVPDQRYAVVSARGELPGVIQQAWSTLAEARLPRAFSFDFDVYHAPTDDSLMQDVDACVALADRTH